MFGEYNLSWRRRLPSFDIWVARNHTETVQAGRVKEISHVYIIPPRINEVLELAQVKQANRIPVFVRYRVHYDIRWVDVNPLLYCEYELRIIDRNGLEQTIAHGMLTPLHPRDVDDRDVSPYFTGKPAPLGLHALKLSLIAPGPGWWTYTYNYSLRVYGTWGW